MIFRWVIFAVLLCGMFEQAFSRNAPLLMRHADSLAAMRKAGFLLLHGRVYFTHDSIAFRTGRATWNKTLDQVECEGNFLFTHPDGFIKANRGSYQRKTEIAIASGAVEAKDSAGTYAFFGDHLVYNKKNKILTLTQKPVLQQYQKQKNGKIDTTTIRAEFISFDQNAEFAKAFQNVVITQGSMIVTCDSGFLDKKNNWVALKGSPKFTMDGYELTGDSIYLTIDSDKRTLKSALVIRNAKGKQHEKGKNGKPDQFTEATGDTLYTEFADDKIKRLYVNLNANGFFYESDFADYKNKMEGGRLDLAFKNGKLRAALISGDAQSSYFHVMEKKRQIDGKNEAAGDTIRIAFSDGKVKHLKLSGKKTLASGRYIDLTKENIFPKMEKDTTMKNFTKKNFQKINDEKIKERNLKKNQEKISAKKEEVK